MQNHRLLLSEVKTNLEELNQIFTKIDEKLKSEDEWLNEITTGVNSGCDKTFPPYEDHKKSRCNEVESVIMWIVFIVFILIVVHIVWFSKKSR